MKSAQLLDADLESTRTYEQFPDVLPKDEKLRTEEPQTKHGKSSLYDSLFELDTPSDEEIDAPQQYGTSLAFANKSDYIPNSSFQITRASSSNVTAAELLDAELPSMVDDYDRMVSRFYTPFKPVPPSRYSLTDAMLAAIPSSSFSRFLKKERQEIQALISRERLASQSAVKPLSQDQLDVVNLYWGSRANKPVVSAYAIDISVRDIQTLNDTCWLNDNVIDFYLNMVTENSKDTYCWTTHFFTTLKSKGYQGVARWAKRRKVNLMEKDLIVVPINIMGTHWAAAAIDNKEQTISYYDSLSSSGNARAVLLLQDYMTKECERLAVDPIQYSLLPNVKTPQQQNGYDCGVFTCTVARKVAERSPLAFSQKDMKTIRRKMAYEIITKSLLADGPGKAHL